jgi:hypothetical protein
LQGIINPKKEILGMVLVRCGIPTYVLWTKNNCLLRIDSNGEASWFYPGLKVVNVFACSKGKHVILLAYKADDDPDSKVLCVWKIKLNEIKPGHHPITTIGAFNCIEDDTIIIESTLTYGDFLRPYRVRIKTMNGIQIEGSFC